MLRSRSEADDAVQEAWLRLSRAETGGVKNLGGWLTTVVAMLRSRKSRREEPIDGDEDAPVASRGTGRTPEDDMQLASSVGLALLVVLETLSPAERVAFVLHAFLAASRGGDFAALLSLLDPDVVLRAGRARAAQPALVDGVPALVWAPGGHRASRSTLGLRLEESLRSTSLPTPTSSPSSM